MEGEGGADEVVSAMQGDGQTQQETLTPSDALASTIPAKRKATIEDSSSSHDDDDGERVDEGKPDSSTLAGAHTETQDKQSSPNAPSTEPRIAETETETRREQESPAPPVKKKSKSNHSKPGPKAKANSSKDTFTVDDRASVTTEDAGTPDVEMSIAEGGGSSSAAATKKASAKKKATAAGTASKGATKGGGKKKKSAALSGQSSAASTPPVADREESNVALAEIIDDEQRQQQQQQNDSDGDDEEETEKLYCICKTLYDDESMMIACDRCDEWYHSACMKMSEDQTKLVDHFICPYCEPLTALRTTWKEKCARNGCTNPARLPLTRYCSEECGMLQAVSRIAKLKQINRGMTPQAMAEKLTAPQILTASKREGVILWSEEHDSGRERRKWLESVLSVGGRGKKTPVMTALAALGGDGAELGLNSEEEARAIIDEMPELEILSRLQARRRQVARLREQVNLTLDTLSARTKLLHLAEDRAPTLEPIQDEAAEEEQKTKSSSKKGSNKKSLSAKAGGGEEGQQQPSSSSSGGAGQPRCGYDDRLNWEDARFHAWSQTEKAREMLEEREALDGTLILDEEGKAALSPSTDVSICGRSRRKCKRHVDWSVIRSAEMEVDRDVQTNLLSVLDEEENEVKTKLEQIQTVIRDSLTRQQIQAREKDALLVLQLANEGTRRAMQLS